MKILFIVINLLLFVSVSAFAQSELQYMYTEKRVALVFGNSAYSFGPLINPQNDANDMAKSLKRCGFKTIKYFNADRKEMYTAIREFGNEIKGGGVGLFYFAGHGMQIDGTNYLLPVGTDVKSEDEVPAECINANLVLRKMEKAGNRLNIVILDACRNNPFAKSFRSSNRGLARMDAPSGSFIAYATAPGSQASDGIGENGLYTSKVLRYIQVPGIRIEDVFKKVRVDVMKATNDIQTPWEASSLTGDFFFILPLASSVHSQSNTSESKQTELYDQILKQSEARKQYAVKIEEAIKKVKLIDANEYVEKSQKIAAWKKFRQDFWENNQYMDFAQDRILYWKNWKPAQIASYNNKNEKGFITTNSGLQYKVIEEGYGLKPKNKDDLRVHYRGKFLDGKEFDSSYKKGKPAVFTLNNVIKGWIEGLQLMREGSKYEFIIPPNLAYGKRGAGKTIPPNCTLFFEVELLGIEKK